ncbi:MULTISPECIES: HIT domain-containing protein [Pseudomonas]|uniref:HIT domain-containing protein n=1 Tax=Pseudomonas quercus TaxID=2722792 RepID=A0ABX0YA26_9PSED|nr:MULTISPECIES: HIT domain-containing protein [Pseudomonas]MBF7141656.1 HIT domain-containing protein [Pseudomonas sp. LY10J]NJP00195.1 HIT domain-containing protein [Pseudomonas quercus]
MFELDPRLQADTWVLGDFPLCRLLLSKDANYPWLILVPRRSGITEAFELESADQAQLARETALVAQQLKAAVEADKINVAALGNVVAQLHIHVIARYTRDAAWPAPVWGRVAAASYEHERLEQFKAQLRHSLTGDFAWADTDER